MNERTYWVALNAVPGVGARTFRNLLERFGSPEEVFASSNEELLNVQRVTPTIVEELRRVGERLDTLDEELALLSDEGVCIMTIEDEAYPSNLRAASDAPPLLYVAGRFLPEDDLAVAVVGSREATSPGLEYAERLAAALAEQGLTVVSGLAAGIDTAAHLGALAAEGRTLGVLGSGLRNVYPPNNRELAERIISGHGAVLSELAPNTPPSGQALMARDRIVSGLSRALIVIEAAERSGSADTADKARKQQRLLYAVDWDDTLTEHAGNRALFAAGASPLPPNLPVDLSPLVSAVLDWTPPAGQQRQSDQLSLL